MQQQVYVWDKFVRLFHWSLVTLFVVSYLTGETESSLHINSGYAIGLLLVARMVWGFIGSKRARFIDFIYSPAKIFAYAKGLINGKPPHYLGHNPLGGLMVFALLVSLSMTVISGLKLYAVEEGKGPLAGVERLVPAALPRVIASAMADDDEHRSESHEENDELWEEMHEAAVNVTLLLIAFHVLGVIGSSLLHRESLVKAMITGYKQQ